MINTTNIASMLFPLHFRLQTTNCLPYLSFSSSTASSLRLLQFVSFMVAFVSYDDDGDDDSDYYYYS